MIIFAYLLVSTPLPADNYEGRVTNDSGEGVGFATIVVVDLDLLETSGEDGTFEFREAAPGSYTILVIAPGYLEWEGEIEFAKGGIETLSIKLDREVIEMETITVIADAAVPEEILDNEVDSEELERLPARSDPFEAVTQESGILKDVTGGVFGRGSGGGGPGGGGPPDGPVDGSFTISIEAGTIGRLNGNQSNRISVYGGESDWNNYYYDYIRLPSNTHAFGYPEPGAIVPVEAVDEIGIHKGVIPVEYGPAIGGLFTLEPVSPAAGFSFTVSPSIMEVGILSRWHVAEDMDLLVSANQSIVQYTVLPLVSRLAPVESEEEVSEEGEPTSFMYGDALLRFSYAPARHVLSFDIVAYYDGWLFDLSFGDFALFSGYGPYYVAVGSNWKFSPTSSVTNSLYAYGSYYRDYGLYDFHFPVTIDFSEDPAEPDAFYDVHIDWVSNVPTVQVGDELFWYLTPSSSLLSGINLRLADLNGIYVENIVQTEASGTELSNESIDLDGVDELFLSAYGYGKYFGNAGSFSYNGGAGLLWHLSESAVRASLYAEFLYAGDHVVVAAGAGWSPGVIDEFSYIDRRLDEQYYELESVTDRGQPPMAISTATQLVYTVSDRHSVGFSPYFAWYYDLSGIAINTSGADAEGAFISYDPRKGYSVGIDINWKAQLTERLDLSLSYAFARTRYFTEEWDWVAPNTEVTHALKSGLLFKIGGLKIGQNLLVYSGTPFTPDVVGEDDFGEIVIVQGDYNSAIDYVPYFDVKTNISYAWSFRRFDMTLFFNSSNWLSVVNGRLLGIDPAMQEIPGATSADFGDREYDYSIELTDFLIILVLSEIGLSFSL